MPSILQKPINSETQQAIQKRGKRMFANEAAVTVWTDILQSWVIKYN